MTAKFLANAELESWLEKVAETHETLVPRREGEAVTFRRFDSEYPVELRVRATQPPKHTVFPQCEALLTFEYDKDAEEAGKVRVDVQEQLGGKPTVVVGGRPCDAAGFTVFDRVYDSERVKDLNYQSRREATIFVSLTCEKPATTCFCNWVGGGPSSRNGSDVLMTPIPGGFVLESVTDKGASLLADGLVEATTEQTEEAASVQSAAEKAMPQPVDMADAREKLVEHFDDPGFWEAEAGKCISCGTCTYLCPTCYCFNISDEQCGHKGVRLRTWDNCMSSLFTQEASGHNPRPTKAHRLKNRVGHKFSYYPSLHEGSIACCGCGRCIKSCPASVDIRSIVMHAIAAPAPSPEG